MSSNRTKRGFNIWAGVDRLLRGDFNRDNEIIEQELDKLEGAIEETNENLFERIYPIGSIYMNVADINPEEHFLGTTWIRVAQGRTLVGVNENDTDFRNPLLTGGAKTHTLTVAQMPSHTHTQNAHTHAQNAHTHALQRASGSGHGLTVAAGFANRVLIDGGAELGATAVNQNTTATNQNTGGGGAHNNLQPYLTTYIWQRTA